MLSGAIDVTSVDGLFTLKNLPGPATVEVSATYEDRTLTKTIEIPESGEQCLDIGEFNFGTEEEPEVTGSCATQLTSGYWSWRGNQEGDDWYIRDLKFYTDETMVMYTRRYDPNYDNGYDGVYNDSFTYGTWFMDGCVGELGNDSGSWTIELIGDELIANGETDNPFLNYPEPQSPMGQFTSEGF